MRRGDIDAWPYRSQAAFALAAAALTVVLITALGGNGPAGRSTKPDMIEAAGGSPLAVPVTVPALPEPVAGVVPEKTTAITEVPPAAGTDAVPAPAPAATTVGSEAPPEAAAPTGAPAAEQAGQPAPAQGQQPAPATQLHGPAGSAPATTSTTTPPTTTSTSTTTTTPAGPVRTPSVEAEVVPLTNRDRNSQCLGSLSRSSCLDGVASNYAELMARNGVLAHNPGAGAAVTGCRPGAAWGDNVGTAGPCSASLLEERWMSSPSHRRNILTAAFQYIGVGAWTDASGSCWVQVLFSS